MSRKNNPEGLTKSHRRERNRIFKAVNELGVAMDERKLTPLHLANNEAELALFQGIFPDDYINEIIPDMATVELLRGRILDWPMVAVH